MQQMSHAARLATLMKAQERLGRGTLTVLLDGEDLGLKLSGNVLPGIRTEVGRVLAEMRKGAEEAILSSAVENDGLASAILAAR